MPTTCERCGQPVTVTATTTAELRWREKAKRFCTEQCRKRAERARARARA